jgi:hypothetical protein
VRQFTVYLRYYPYLIAGLWALTLVVFGLALFALRRQRFAEVWRARHTAGKHASRLLGVSLSAIITLAVVTGVSFSLIFAFGLQDWFFPPSNPYNLTGIALAYLSTPTVPAALTPVAPNGFPRLTLDGIAADPNQTVVHTPPITLPAGGETLYFALHYHDMPLGALWSRILYYNQQPIQTERESWGWGATGEQHLAVRHPDGAYPAGEYALVLFIGEETVARIEFNLR